LRRKIVTMVKLIGTLVGVLVGAALGFYARGALNTGVVPLNPYTFLDHLSDAQAPFLSATGTWRGADIANRVNTVSVVCDSVARTCDINQADVYALSGSQEYLSLHSTHFRIAHFDQKMVTAVNSLELPCVRQTLMIDRQAKTVSLVRTKINSTEMCGPVQDTPLTISLGKPIEYSFTK
jgi:hypothetical protein